MEEHLTNNSRSSGSTSSTYFTPNTKPVSTKPEEPDNMAATSPTSEDMKPEFGNILDPPCERPKVESEPGDGSFQDNRNGSSVPEKPGHVSSKEKKGLFHLQDWLDTAEGPQILELQRLFGPTLEPKTQNPFFAPLKGKEKQESAGSKEVLETTQEVNTTPLPSTTTTADPPAASKDEPELSEEELQHSRTEDLETRFQEVKAKLEQAKRELRKEEAKLKEAEKAEREARQKLQHAKAPRWKVKATRRKNKNIFGTP